MRITMSCAGNNHPAHISPAPERAEDRAGRPHPHRHRNYHMDFFLEHQILCIVSKEGTKFCSLIENRLFMRSDNRHISERMQLNIMREIHKDICRLCYGGEPVD